LQVTSRSSLFAMDAANKLLSHLAVIGERKNVFNCLWPGLTRMVDRKNFPAKVESHNV
jgi:hypothetical protein